MKKGFTLIELLVSVGIILVLVLSGQTLQRASLRLHSINQERLAALNASRAQMECLQAASFDSLLSYNGKSFAKSSGTIHIRPLTPDLYEISVVYTLSSGKQLAFSSLRSAY